MDRCGVEFASPCIAGEAIVRLTPTKNELAEALHILREAFGGNDYHVLRFNGASSLEDAEAGHLMALFSRSPFRLNLGTRILNAERDRQVVGQDYYLLKLVVEDVGPSLVLEGGEAVPALSVLPAFMNVESY